MTVVLVGIACLQLDEFFTAEWTQPDESFGRGIQMVSKQDIATIPRSQNCDVFWPRIQDLNGVSSITLEDCQGISLRCAN
jgi:hypothetical protein